MSGYAAQRAVSSFSRRQDPTGSRYRLLIKSTTRNTSGPVYTFQLNDGVYQDRTFPTHIVTFTLRCVTVWSVLEGKFVTFDGLWDDYQVYMDEEAQEAREAALRD